MCRPTRSPFRGRLIRPGEMSEDDARLLHRGTGGSTYMKESVRDTGSPATRSGMANRTPARDRPGAHGVAERLAAPLKPGNAGGGKGPQFETGATRSEGPGDWASLTTPDSVQKLKDGVARESEGGTRLPCLSPLRQDQPRRHPGACLCSVPFQQGRARCRRSGIRGRRGVRVAAMAW